MPDLVFHLLDIQSKDIRIEAETEEAREVVYESADEDEWEDEEGMGAGAGASGRRRRRAAPATGRRQFLLHLFGATAEGHSVRVDVEGFRPTLYIALPPEKNTRLTVDAIRTYLEKQKVPIDQLDFRVVQRKKFYGFTANRLFPFVEVSCPSLFLWRNVKNLFLDDKCNPATKKSLGTLFKSPPEVYEANLDPMLRFLHVQGLNPCGWVSVADGTERIEDPDATMWVLGCNSTDVTSAVGPAPSAPFLEASWDIECYSATGDFPVPSKTWTDVATLFCGPTGSLNTLQTYLATCATVTQPTKLAEKLATPVVRAALQRQRAGVEEDEEAAIGAVAAYLKKHLDDFVVLGDPVIQIGTTLARNGVPFERHLFVFPDCAEIPGIEVHPFKDEKGMIDGWFKWLVEVNPDNLMGYNVFGFDEKYLWKRAEVLGCVSEGGDTDEVHGLSRLVDTGALVKLEEKRLSSSALGDNFLYMWSVHGRLQVDMFQYIKRSASLPSYKLDEVTKHYLSGKLKKYRAEEAAAAGGAGAGAASAGERSLVLELSGAVKDLRPGRALCLLDETGESITNKMVISEVRGAGIVVVPWPTLNDDLVAEEDLKDAAKWVVVKDDVGPQDIFKLHRGSAADRAIVGKYCLQDCDLVLELYRKLEVFNNSMSMANVCCVPIGYIFTRGQGVKIESLMFRACRERNTLIPVLPSPKDGGEEDSYEGAIVLDPEPGFYSKSPIGVADFASLYPSTIESENISHDSLVWVKDFDYEGRLIGMVWGSEEYDEDSPALAATGTPYSFTDIEFDIWRPDPEDKRKHPVKKKCGLRICRYAQPLDGSKSTLPEIIRGLLAARKAKRVEGERETDPGRKALLDAEQLAYKLTANSLYGQLGSSTFKIRLQALAASVTAYGRKQIMFAKSVIERFYGGGAIALGGRVRCDARCEAKVVYGDSVTGDTPLLLKSGTDAPFLSRVDELLTEREWATYHETKEAIDISDLGLSVWTERGYTPIRRIIRHRLAPTKKLFRILTHTGVADVTEDHSLVLSDGKEAKPADVVIGTELLHSDTSYTSLGVDACEITEREVFVMGLFVADGSSDVYATASGSKATWAINKADMALLERAKELCPFETRILDTLASSGVYKLVPVGDHITPARKYRELFYNQHREKRIPPIILNAPLPIVRAFWEGFYAGDGDKDAAGYTRVDQKGKEICAGLALLAQRLGYKVSITDRLDKQSVFRLTMTTKSQRKNPIAIKKIRELPHPGDAYVYDLETENHHFAVGPGALVVHNTDSLFVEFNPVNPETGERLTGRDARQAVIDLTAEAGHLVTQALAPPHDFEFDKVFDPMLMFSKKRYAGLMFENNADDYVYKYMGIALKRRDNAPIVKAIFGSAMKKLLNDRDIPAATEMVQRMSMDLVEGKVSLGQLTITKSLRAEYADPSRIAHKALADRIAIRDPGNAPASGDRIPFVYIRPAVGAEAAKLQGDRIETPSYVREKALVPDYEFYLEHQIQNPVSQMFGLLLEEMPGFKPEMLARAPEEPEKRLVFRESVAAEILFRAAYQACHADSKRAYFSRFFGSAEPKPVAKPVALPRLHGTTPKAAGGAGAGAGAPALAPAPTLVKARQTTLSFASNMVRDEYLVRKIVKGKAEKRKAAEAKKDEKGVVEAKEELPAAVPVLTDGSLVADALLLKKLARKRPPKKKAATAATAEAEPSVASD